MYKCYNYNNTRVYSKYLDALYISVYYQNKLAGDKQGLFAALPHVYQNCWTQVDSYITHLIIIKKSEKLIRCAQKPAF